ncbi:hypothetical protein AcetOrient_orf00471 [Acetobacter orientalis]|uniref:Uncharacterized protein n=1 Tax=Acetobacter orientalis TaxID=146474 RepID=A0A2Z5ZE46_9PROT|nr:hypothetical protein AcetOrient_orf00471 [Acetobacter orientalis]
MISFYGPIAVRLTARNFFLRLSAFVIFLFCAGFYAPAL